MAGGPGVREAWLVQGSCLCPAKRERQPGAGQPSDLGIWLGYGKWRSGFLLQLQNTQELVLPWALEAGEWKELQWIQVRCLCSVLCPFSCPPLREASCSGVPCGQRLLVMDTIPRPCGNSWVPKAGWVRCWSAKILGWAVSGPFESDLDVCTVEDIVLGTLSS